MALPSKFGIPYQLTCYLMPRLEKTATNYCSKCSKKLKIDEYIIRTKFHVYHEDCMIWQ